MNSLSNLFYAVLLAGGIGMLLGGIDRHLSDWGVQYYWHAVVAGFIGAATIYFGALSKGLKDKELTDIETIFKLATMGAGVVASPLAFVMFTPDAGANYPPLMMQVGLPVAAFAIIASSGAGLIEWDNRAGNERNNGTF